MKPELEAALAAALGSEVTGSRPLGGGDINEAYAADLADGRRVFVKTNRRADPRMFPAEARGLAWLAEPDAIRVPEVLAVSEPGDEPAFLALELLEPGPRRGDYDRELGRRLATLHRAHPDGFGLDHDNFIGSLDQDNTPCETWADFYVQRRLEPMVKMAIERGPAPASWARDFDRLYARMPELVGPLEPPARLHGDLWSGNLHTDERGAPCLIDPAVYGGHREVDLAMLVLFGRPGPDFFHAYDEVWPRAPGHDDRVPLYQLYPLLVHVNLFGTGYVGSVESALRRYL